MGKVKIYVQIENFFDLSYNYQLCQQSTNNQS